MLWYPLRFLTDYFGWGDIFSNFSIIEADWKYSTIILFIISRIISSNLVQERINDNSKKIIIFMIILLIIGLGIAYFLSLNFENYIYKEYNYIYNYINVFIYMINISIFSILLFKFLKINIEEKHFIILSTCICVIIIFIFNIIPIKKINAVRLSQEKAYEIFDSDTTTYKNVLQKIEEIIPDTEENKSLNKIWDYQQVSSNEGDYWDFIKEYLSGVSKKHYNKVVEQTETFINTVWIYPEKELCNIRILSIAFNTVIVSYIGAYLILKSNKHNEII